MHVINHPDIHGGTVYWYIFLGVGIIIYEVSIIKSFVILINTTAKTHQLL